MTPPRRRSQRSLTKLCCPKSLTGYRPVQRWAAAHQSGIVVGQQAVREKENELGAIARLLDQLDLRGLVLTGNPQFTQREVCRQVVGKGGITSLR